MKQTGLLASHKFLSFIERSEKKKEKGEKREGERRQNNGTGQNSILDVTLLYFVLIFVFITD